MHCYKSVNDIYCMRDVQRAERARFESILIHESWDALLGYTYKDPFITDAEIMF